MTRVARAEIKTDWVLCNRCHALNKELNVPCFLNLRIYTFEKTS
jgi:hypothetical protein